jgi:hypothetical protein
MRGQVFMLLETLMNLLENKQKQNSRAYARALIVVPARKLYGKEGNTGHAAQSFHVPHDATWKRFRNLNQ